MKFPAQVFRAYDIRGIAAGANAEITPEFARALGQAFVAELGEKNPRIAIGRDNRLTGESLSAALREGLVAGGAEVLDLDYATSPYLYFAVCQGNLASGIEITASHNPPEFNGFKIVRRSAAPLAGTDILKLHERMENIEPMPEIARGKSSSADLKKEYFAKLQTLAPCERKLKVVVDCGNGTAGYFAPDFLRQLGVEVSELFCEPDGSFPNHTPDPENTKTLRELQKRVVAEGADLGIAFDGDGDRLGVVDERGDVIAPDRLIILLARDLLARKPGAEIIFDGKCSNILAMEIERAGGVARRWKTGHSFIKQKMRETGALLAGEVSGHIFFAEDYFGVDDAFLAAAKIISIAARAEKSLSELFTDLPATFISPDIKIGVARRSEIRGAGKDHDRTRCSIPRLRSAGRHPYFFFGEELGADPREQHESVSHAALRSGVGGELGKDSEDLGWTS